MSDEMISLKVNSQAKKIKVNDNGEYIVLNLDDQRFLPDLLDLMNDFKRIAAENEDRVKVVEAMPEDTEQEKMEKVAASAAVNLEVCKELSTRVDKTFRDCVCRKVFGDIVPSVASFAEFFDQIGALVKRFAEEQKAERDKRVQKYTGKYHQKG